MDFVRFFIYFFVKSFLFGADVDAAALLGTKLSLLLHSSSSSSSSSSLSLPLFVQVHLESNKTMHAPWSYICRSLQCNMYNVQCSAGLFHLEPSHWHHLVWPSNDGDAELDHLEEQWQRAVL